jgi:sugar lactone lactonase YvrE
MKISHSLAMVFVILILSACRGAQPPPVYLAEPLVEGGSPFHGVHGLRFDRDDTLYAVSVIGQSILRVDIGTGAVETFVGPREGMADDLAIHPDGTFVWTAIEDGIVYTRSPEGDITRLMENQKGVNAVSFSPEGDRLFVTLVFYGDALYELDVTGAEPPRLVVENIGGLNAFEIAEDGMIYGPLVSRGQVVQIHPDSGEVAVITDEVEAVGALKLAGDGTAYVLDNGAGSLLRVNLATGETTVVTELPFGADNLDVNSEGHVFVSLSEVNAIVDVEPITGETRYVVDPAPFTSVTGLAVVTDGDGDTLYLSDLFGGVKLLRVASSTIEKTPVDIFQPAHISVAGDRFIVVSEVSGVVQLIDRETYVVVGEWSGFDSPGDALEALNGDIIVAETGTGRLLRVTGPAETDRRVITDELAGPTGLAWASDNVVYVTETDGGRVVRVEIDSGATSVESTGLDQPEGIAVADDGSMLVVEVGARQLSRIEPMGGTESVIATDLSVGFANGPSMFRGVAVSASAIYINSDVENTIYSLTPQP